MRKAQFSQTDNFLVNKDLYNTEKEKTSPPLQWRLWSRTPKPFLCLVVVGVSFVCELLVHILYQFFYRGGVSHWFKKILTRTVTHCKSVTWKIVCECVLSHLCVFGHINAVKCIHLSFTFSAFEAMFWKALSTAVNTAPSLEMAQINPPFLLTLWQESMPPTVFLHWAYITQMKKKLPLMNAVRKATDKFRILTF